MTTAYMCHDWTPDEEAQIESLSEKEVCESLNLVSTEGFPFCYISFLKVDGEQGILSFNAN